MSRSLPGRRFGPTAVHEGIGDIGMSRSSGVPDTPGHADRSFRARGIRKLHRQNELKPRAALAVRQRGKLAAVALDNHPANGQAQSHSICLSRNEGLEYAVKPALTDPRSRI